MQTQCSSTHWTSLALAAPTISKDRSAAPHLAERDYPPRPFDDQIDQSDWRLQQIQTTRCAKTSMRNSFEWVLAIADTPIPEHMTSAARPRASAPAPSKAALVAAPARSTAPSSSRTTTTTTSSATVPPPTAAAKAGPRQPPAPPPSRGTGRGNDGAYRGSHRGGDWNYTGNRHYQ